LGLISFGVAALPIKHLGSKYLSVSLDLAVDSAAGTAK
jgi:hypothetical protein